MIIAIVLLVVGAVIAIALAGLASWVCSGTDCFGHDPDAWFLAYWMFAPCAALAVAAVIVFVGVIRRRVIWWVPLVAIVVPIAIGLIALAIMNTQP